MIDDLIAKYPEVMTSDLGRRIIALAFQDANQLISAERSYGDSWQARGGVGAFMNLARKWDRLSQACERQGWDIFLALESDVRAEGLADDLRDLRHYTILIDLRSIRAPQYVKEVTVIDLGLKGDQVMERAVELRDDDPVHPQEGARCSVKGCTGDAEEAWDWEFCIIHQFKKKGYHHK